jgi:hypothetical protein
MKYLIVIFGLIAVGFLYCAFPIAVLSFACDFFTGTNYTTALSTAASIALDMMIIALVGLVSATVLYFVHRDYNEKGIF